MAKIRDYLGHRVDNRKKKAQLYAKRKIGGAIVYRIIVSAGLLQSAS